MKLIKKLMGRRQFLVTAGLASGCALTCKKIAGFMDRNFEPETAMAAERAAAPVNLPGNRCRHLMSPLRIRNVILKNRIMHTVSPTYLMQGPENFPGDIYRNHYCNMAKNAAIVTMNTHWGKYPKHYVKGQHGPSANFCDDAWQEIPPVHNYVDRLMDDIHSEGALILYGGNTGGQGNLGIPGNGIVPGKKGAGAASNLSNAIGGSWPGGMPGGASGPGGMPGGASGPGGMPGGAGGRSGGPGGMPGGPGSRKQKSIKDIVAEAKEVENKGYDVYQIDGGNPKAVEAVRNATNLIVMAHLRVGGHKTYGLTRSNQPSADEVEKGVEAARRLEGVADYVWIRLQEHPNAWIQDKDKPYSLAFSEAIKKANIKLLTCPSAGYHYPIMNDGFIASKKADMIGMTTPFFADAELVRKVMAGRADDVLPCIMCEN